VLDEATAKRLRALLAKKALSAGFFDKLDNPPRIFHRVILKRHLVVMVHFGRQPFRRSNPSG